MPTQMQKAGSISKWLKSRLGLAVALSLLGAPVIAGESYTIPVRFDDHHPKATRFGKLEFLGGVDWRSRREDFGGFSGLLLEKDQITALTDKSHWFQATLAFTNGRLTGINGLKVGRLSGANNKYLQRPYMDSEAIIHDEDGYLIAFEGKHRISRFATLKAPGFTIPGLPRLDRLGANQGIEAMVKLPDGRLILVAEEPPNRTGNHIGWIMGEGPPQLFSIVRRGHFSPTDMTLSPDGKSIYLLERRFSLLGGPGMHVRRFPVSDIVARAAIKGETLIDRGAGYAVDNMEAIASRVGAFGLDELFILSDDNFSARQRTLMLHFRVMD